MTSAYIPFNRPFVVGRELGYIRQAIANSHLSGDGPFTRKCHEWLEKRCGSAKALLTHSCTAALEMAAILAGVQSGDEIIMPSYTFVSTANAFVLRGGVPVFVDIREDTLNLDETKIEEAITPRTRAIAPVHYAGIGCQMDAVLAIARKYDLLVIEDAAQGLLSSYGGQPLGTIGHLGTVSFHETKTVISGEGGALLVNEPRWIDRAEIVREKGTNRSKFFRGEVDKYTWVDIGSSYLPSEIIAAFLWAQLEDAERITERRLALWQQYHATFADLESRGKIRRPVVPAGCTHNAHMYYVLLPSAEARRRALQSLKTGNINAVSHYVPLHTSPAGRKLGRSYGDLSVTEDLSQRLIRLPLWVGMTEEMIQRVVTVLQDA
jgi:dTDP-4-amino-4,6-dideoxygalactose transaminase